LNHLELHEFKILDVQCLICLRTMYRVCIWELEINNFNRFG